MYSIIIIIICSSSSSNSKIKSYLILLTRDQVLVSCLVTHHYKSWFSLSAIIFFFDCKLFQRLFCTLWYGCNLTFIFHASFFSQESMILLMRVGSFIRGWWHFYGRWDADLMVFLMTSWGPSSSSSSSSSSSWISKSQLILWFYIFYEVLVCPYTNVFDGQ